MVIIKEIGLACHARSLKSTLRSPHFFLNGFVNGKTRNKPDVNLVQTPLDNNMQLAPTNFKTMNKPTQMVHTTKNRI